MKHFERLMEAERDVYEKAIAVVEAQGELEEAEANKQLDEAEARRQNVVKSLPPKMQQEVAEIDADLLRNMSKKFTFHNYQLNNFVVRALVNAQDTVLRDGEGLLAKIRECAATELSIEETNLLLSAVLFELSTAESITFKEYRVKVKK